MVPPETPCEIMYRTVLEYAQGNDNVKVEAMQLLQDHLPKPGEKISLDEGLFAKQKAGRNILHDVCSINHANAVEVCQTLLGVKGIRAVHRCKFVSFENAFHP